MLRRGALALLIAGIAALAPSAAGAAVPGSLAPLGPPGGCVGFWTLTFVGCATSSDLGGSSVALAPDTRQLYVTDFGGSLAVVQRDPLSGAVALDTAQAPCLEAAGVTHSAACQPARGLSGATDVAVSPDGAFVYASGWQYPAMSPQLIAGSVTTFARDPVTGALTQLPGAVGCLQQVAIASALAPGDETCGAATGIPQPVALVISADGAFVYVASRGGAVQAFGRDATTGVLTPLGGATPTGLTGAVSGLALSPDGAQLYVTGGRVAVIQRDAVTGALGRSTTGRAPGPLSGPVAFSADGTTAFAAGSAAAVTAFRRARGTGALTAVAGRRGCVAQGRTLRRRCTRTQLPVDGVVASGRFVYGFNVSYGVSAFAQAAGGVRALPGRAGCLVTPDSRNRTARGCTKTAAGMYGPQGMVATPDGRFVYVTTSLVTALVVAR